MIDCPCQNDDYCDCACCNDCPCCDEPDKPISGEEVPVTHDSSTGATTPTSPPSDPEPGGGPFDVGPYEALVQKYTEKVWRADGYRDHYAILLRELVMKVARMASDDTKRVVLDVVTEEELK